MAFSYYRLHLFSTPLFQPGDVRATKFYYIITFTVVIFLVSVTFQYVIDENSYAFISSTSAILH